MPTDRPKVGVSFVDPASIVMIEPRMGARGRSVLAGLMLISIVFVVYVRTLWGGFIHLDNVTIVQNMPLRSAWSGLWNIWVHPIVLPHYEPMAYSLLLAEFKVFTTRLPGGYLAINLILHACNAVLLWRVLKRLDVPGGLAAAILFAVHPLNVQAVGWISQQPLLLSMFFSLLTVMVWLRWSGIDAAPPDTGKIFRLPSSPLLLYLLVALLLAGAMSSHSIAVALPLVLLMVDWWKQGVMSRREFKAAGPLIVMSLLWAWVICTADYRRAAAVNGFPEADFLTRLTARPIAAWGYLAHFLIPLRLSLIYPGGSIAPWMAGISLAAAAGVLALLWPMRSRWGRGPFAAAVMVLALLLPTFVLRTDLDEWTHRADQLFYFPAAVIVIAIVVGLNEWMRRFPRGLPRITTAALGIVLGILSIVRLGDFQSSERLWGSVLRHDPDSVVALNQLGMIELEEHRGFAQARERFLRALRVNPRDLRSMLNLASSYELEGDIDTMMMRYREAMSLAPDDPAVHLGLGNALAAKKDYNGAISEYTRVLNQLPGDYQATYRLGLAYRGLGDHDRAVKLFEEAIRINPFDVAPYNDLANLDFAHGRYEEGLEKLALAKKIDVRNYRVYVNIAAHLGTLAQIPEIPQGQRDKLIVAAEDNSRAAVYYNPTSAEARYNLGGILFNRGKLDDAIFQLSKAVELSPHNADFRQALKLAQDTRAASRAR